MVVGMTQSNPLAVKKRVGQFAAVKYCDDLTLPMMVMDGLLIMSTCCVCRSHHLHVFIPTLSFKGPIELINAGFEVLFVKNSIARNVALVAAALTHFLA